MFKCKKIVIAISIFSVLPLFWGCGDSNKNINESAVSHEESNINDVALELEKIKNKARAEGKKLKEKIENDSNFLRSATDSAGSEPVENIFSVVSSLADETFEEVHDLARDVIPGVEISSQEEEKIGNHVKKEIFKDHPRWNKPEIHNYVQNIVDKMIEQTEAFNENIEVTLLDTDDIGAYALPGRNILITRGILKLMENEAQLVGVLGHEMGHIYLEHSLRRVRTSRVPARILEQIGVVDETTLIEYAGEMMTAVFTHPLSQPAEFRADAYGAVFSLRAGYNGYGLIEILQSLDEISEYESKFLLNNILSTHPKTSRRIAVLKSILSTVDSPNRLELNFSRPYDQIVKNL